ncbi:MAG: sorbosone dehydrogenase family protein [Gaiellaceae bacterium]
MGLASFFAAACALVAPCADAQSAPRPHFVPYVRGLQSPVYVAAPRSEPGRLYVVEQAGRIVVLDGRKRRSTPFLDLRGRITAGGEQGLLSMAFHPKYEATRLVYVNYTDADGHTRVVEYRTNGTRAIPRTARLVLFVEQPYPNHNGGQLQFGPDGRLYVGMGDGGSGGDPENYGQDLNSLLGKLVSINVDRPDTEPRIDAYGLRNPWRFSFDRKTGDLYVGDVGQGSWEEINFLRARSTGIENYGWAAYEGRERYDDREVNAFGRLVFPVAVYSHDAGCSVTGGYVYRGKAVPAAVGRYYYGDYCSGFVWSLRIRGGKAFVRREAFDLPVLSSFGEDAGGELYATSLNGVLYKLVRSST